MKILSNKKYQELLSGIEVRKDLSIAIAQNRIDNDMYKRVLEEYGIEILEDKIEKEKTNFQKIRKLHFKKGKTERFACCRYLLCDITTKD